MSGRCSDSLVHDIGCVDSIIIKELTKLIHRCTIVAVQLWGSHLNLWGWKDVDELQVTLLVQQNHWSFQRPSCYLEFLEFTTGLSETEQNIPDLLLRKEILVCPPTFDFLLQLHLVILEKHLNWPRWLPPASDLRSSRNHYFWLCTLRASIGCRSRLCSSSSPAYPDSCGSAACFPWLWETPYGWCGYPWSWSGSTAPGCSCCYLASSSGTPSTLWVPRGFTSATSC